MAMTLKAFNEITREAKRTGTPPTVIAMNLGYKRFDYSNHKYRRKAKARQKIERQRGDWVGESSAIKVDRDAYLRGSLAALPAKRSVSAVIQETSRHLAKMLYDRMVRP